jgi:hypothetical protein
MTKKRRPSWPSWKPVVWTDLQRVQADALAAIAAKEMAVDDQNQLPTNGNASSDKELGINRDAFKRIMKGVAENQRHIEKRLRPRGAGAAFLAYHEIDVELTTLLTTEQLQGRVPETLQQVRAYLPPDDPLRVAFEDRWAPPETVSVRASAASDKASKSHAEGAAFAAKRDAEKKAIAANIVLHAAQRDVASLPPETAADRELFRTALQSAYRFGDIAQGRVRQLRNLLILTVLAMLALLGLLIGVATQWPAVLPLCAPIQGSSSASGSEDPTATTSISRTVTATTTATSTATATKTVEDPPAAPAASPSPPTSTATPTTSGANGQLCATGNTKPTGGDAPLVALLGATGAALAGGITLSKLRLGTTLYALKAWQAVVKISFGPITAILGVLFLNTGLLTSSGILPSGQVVLLTYAVIFGTSQQLITRFIDQKASEFTTEASPISPAKSRKSDETPDDGV